MTTRAPLLIVALSEMVHGQEADVFVLMTAKEELTTRDGKPYFKVGFRDHAREVTFPICKSNADKISTQDLTVRVGDEEIQSKECDGPTGQLESETK